MEIKYVKGDLFELIPKDKPVMIPHVCNDVGAFSAGFVAALNKRFPTARENYLQLRKELGLSLGNTQIVTVDEKQPIFVANMISQHGLISVDNPVPLKYLALVKCMEAVRKAATDHQCQIFAPKFGSQLAGGCWEFIELLIQEAWDGLETIICVLD
jgi:hypothetical protein